MTGECHTVGLLDDGVKAEHLRVHLQRRDCAGGDNDGAEAVEDGFDGNGCVETSEVEDGVWDGGGVRFVGLQDQQETFVVGCG